LNESMRVEGRTLLGLPDDLQTRSTLEFDLTKAPDRAFDERNSSRACDDQLPFLPAVHTHKSQNGTSLIDVLVSIGEDV
jgi:hypothetical protein